MNTKGISSILRLLLILGIFISYAFPAPILAGEEGAVFSTWDDFEADKCASIWVIKRFIDKDAVIKFFPKGEVIEEGILFDTPDARLRRYHNMSTFESILEHYDLKDPKLIHLSKIIHDIEVNTWDRKVFPESRKIRDEINGIVSKAGSSAEAAEECAAYFELLYTSGE